MARQNVTTTHPLTWEKIQNEFDKINSNFLEVYAATGADFSAINSTISPVTTDSHDLGENLKRWRNIYLSGVEFQEPQDIGNLDPSLTGIIDFTVLGVSAINSNVLIIDPALETTITLPQADATGMPGIRLVIKNYDTVENVIVIDPAGPSTLATLTAGTAILLVSDGYSWTKISDSSASGPSGDITADSIQLETGNQIVEFSNDASMLDNDPNIVPTQFAVKSYVDSSVSGISVPSDINQLTDSTSLLKSNEDIDDRVSNLIVAGQNIVTTYQDIDNTLTVRTKNSLNFGTLNGNLSTNLVLQSYPEYQRFILTATTSGLSVQLPNRSVENEGIFYIFTNRLSGVSYTVNGQSNNIEIPDNVTKIITWTGSDYNVVYSTDSSALSTFKTISVSGQSDVVADSTTDTLTLVAGSGITIATNDVNDSITISSTGGASIGRSNVIASSIYALGETRTFDLTGPKSYLLYKITTTNAAWVRVYTDAASRTADSSRLEGVDPLPGSGVIAEIITLGNQTVLMSPGVVGFNNDAPVANTVYLAVTNKSGSSGTNMVVDLTVLGLE